ncbi:hypothetical protein DYB32_004592, partial [Aphanomyces invadans]
LTAGAFGAHALQSRVKNPKRIKTWETASHYHLIHSVALLAVPLARRPNVAGGFLTAGIVLFSGSLYTLVLSDQAKLGIITVRLTCDIPAHAETHDGNCSRLGALRLSLGGWRFYFELVDQYIRRCLLGYSIYSVWKAPQ